MYPYEFNCWETVAGVFISSARQNDSCKKSISTMLWFAEQLLNWLKILQSLDGTLKIAKGISNSIWDKQWYSEVVSYL